MRMADKYKKLLGVIGITAAVYIGLRYLLAYVAPFFAAYLFVRLVNPLTRKIQDRMKIKKEWSTVFLLLLVTGALAFGCWILCDQLIIQIRNVVMNLDGYRRSFGGMVDGCCQALEGTFGINGEDIRQFIYQNIEYMEDRVQVYILPGLFNSSIKYAAGILKGIATFFVIFVAVTLLIRDYDEINDRLLKYSPYRKFLDIMDRLWNIGGAYLKAQLSIILIVTVLCVLGLWLLGNPYALLVGIVIGLLDALPFIGTGTILLPWAVICLIRGDFFFAASYATLFLITNGVREYLEPVLLGDKLGVYPIVIAIVVYAGICIFGVAGVILGPVMLFLVVEILKAIFPKKEICEMKEQFRR